MSTANAEANASIISVLDSAPWEFALFTTYTLSLPFFEAYFLPRLEQVGCSNITILVDSQWYLETVCERRAALVGRAYTVHPVTLRNGGVFHPKLTYLSAERMDFLAVSSGNLTLSGQGGNLECVDFANSDHEPGVFHGFSAFLKALGSSERIQLGQVRQLTSMLATRSSRFPIPPPTTPQNTSFLHSTTESIESQLVEAAKHIEPIKRLFCLSPFHGSDATPVLRLAHALKAERVDIGVDPATRSTSINATSVNDTGIALRFVGPDKSETRPLHAKWYEVHGSSILQCTGSVNATNAALSTTANVEAALLRVVEDGACLSWKTIKNPPYRPQTFSASHTRFAGTVTATVDLDWNVVGHVHSSRLAVEGSWSGTVCDRFSDFDIGSVAVSSDGEFRFQLPKALVDTDDVVHFRMNRGQALVAGWLNFLFDLEGGVELRGTRLAIRRIADGQPRAGDVLQALQWLTRYLEHPSVNRSAAAPGSEVSDERSTTVRISAIALTFAEWVSIEPSRRHTLEGMAATLADRVLRLLALGKKRLVQRAKATGGFAGDDTLSSDLEDDRADPTEFDAIETLIEVIDRILANSNPTFAVSQLVRVKADLVFSPPLDRGDWHTASHKGLAFLRWLAALKLPSEQIEALAPLICSLAAMTQFHVPSDRASAMAVDLKELVQRLFASPKLTTLETLASQGLKQGCFSDIPERDGSAWISQLQLVLAAPTLREELGRWVEARSARINIDPPTLLMQLVPERVLKAMMRTRDYHRISDPNCKSCPSCRSTLLNDQRVVLRSRRAEVCRNCGVVLIWLGD